MNATAQAAERSLGQVPPIDDLHKATLRARLLGLIAFRLAIAGVLLAVVAASETVWARAVDSSRGLSMAVSLIFVSALVHVILVARGAVNVGIALTQVAIDLGLLSWVALETGGGGSPLLFLFSVVVIEAATTLPRRWAAAFTGVAVCALYALVLGTALQAAPVHVPLWLVVKPLLPSLVSSTVGMVAVAALSFVLVSETSRARLRLQTAESALDRLGDLHERVLLGLSSGIVTIDRSGMIGFANPAALQILGAERLAGLRLAEVSPALSRIALDEALDRERGEVSLKVRERDITIGLSVLPILASDSAVWGRTLIFKDLTEIREAERRAERNERLASLGRLSANIAHEIRNPLGALSGSIELIAQSERLGGQDRALIEIVLREVSRLNALVTDFLEYARPPVAMRIETELGTLVSETIKLFRQDSLLGERSLEWSAPQERNVALVDPGQLRQILLNLLRNAALATPEKGRIRVSLARRSSGFCMSVADDGGGIDAALLEHVFEPFSSHGSRGNGLGLAIVAQLARSNSGSVQVERRDGWTVFDVVVGAE